MSKHLLFLSLYLSFSNIYAQSNDSILTRLEYQSEMSQLKRRIESIEKHNYDLQRTVIAQKEQINTITLNLKFAQSNIQQIADSLHIAIRNVSSENKQAQNQLNDINQSISNRTFYWIIGILAIVLLSVIAFITLRSRIASSANTLGSQIAKTNETVQNEAIKLDSKLIEIMQTQLSILKEERKAKGTATGEVDHKLPLKVGDEIHRMRKRIENMPQDVKGLSALVNSIQRLEEEFNESGYGLEDLLGKKYVNGMKLEARFVDNPNIPKGEEIITDVLRPQIMYKGSVIQIAKVEVSKSY